ncbi:hypothetical protein GCM10025880_18300 [Methylorubrum aminovorans]|nr:hypothetical protein GCM10025880_18300 [Methylorubrum aminovorans]
MVINEEEAQGALEGSGAAAPGAASKSDPGWAVIAICLPAGRTPRHAASFTHRFKAFRAKPLPVFRLPRAGIGDGARTGASSIVP